PAVSRDEFVRKTAELLAANRPEAARRWAGRYPDVALDVLRNAVGAAADPALLVIARAQDEQCGQPGAAQTWHALLQDRAAARGRYAAFDAARVQLLAHVREGKPGEAAAVQLVKLAPGPLLEIEAQRLTGEALVLAERPAEAVPAFEAALRRAREGHPHQ